MPLTCRARMSMLMSRVKPCKSCYAAACKVFLQLQ